MINERFNKFDWTMPIQFLWIRPSDLTVCRDMFSLHLCRKGINKIAYRLSCLIVSNSYIFH